MQLPGLPGAMEDPVLREKAEAEAERLGEDLKKEVQAEVKDIGVLRKELRVTVPAKVISDHIDHNLAELKSDAIVPGFRKGRAPRVLIVKRFGPEVRESLTTSILGQSFLAAVERHKLEVLGDPVFRVEVDGKPKLVEIDEALSHFKLPEAADFSYTCEVEVKPEFTLPELEGISLQMPQVQITEEMISHELLRRRLLRGRFEPVPDGTAEPDDLVVADVRLRVGDQEVKHEENVQLGVRPSRVDGILLRDLDSALKGARIGETRTAEGVIPDDYNRPDLRGQTGRFEFTLHEIKRLAPAPLEDTLRSAGFKTEAELREVLAAQLELQRDDFVRRAKRDQIAEYLLKHVQLELPEQLSHRQAERAVLRRLVELHRRGVPESDLMAQADALRTSAREEVARELRLGFILDKIAEQLQIEVTDEEVNSEIARIARAYNRRFDRVRDDLQKQDMLGELTDKIRQDKVFTWLLEKARVEEAPAPAPPPAPEAAAGGPGAE